MQNGEPWWVLADVCKVLEITNTGNASARLDEDEKATIQITDSGNLNADRTIMQNGEPWWVLADVCKVLEISKHRDAASRLDDDERGSVLVDTLGGLQSMTAINESGLYSLILTSRKPAAKRFKKWVTSEVLPAIRKTGGYMVASLI
ncbi:Bro-N domain-containing protein [Acetobacter senegalensis]|nr:Bro-N domain-containing protein [Acetobacter senegalensis]